MGGPGGISMASGMLNMGPNSAMQMGFDNQGGSNAAHSPPFPQTSGRKLLRLFGVSWYEQ